MSLENVEIVQRLYEAWARQEVPGPSGLPSDGAGGHGQRYEWFHTPGDALQAVGLEQ